MDTALAQKAINLALSGKWDEAQKVNLEILKFDPQNLDALNRLARSYAELGKISEARVLAKKVLDLDPVNTIAQKCLDKWAGVKKVEINGPTIISADAFLEESGKTKLVTLLHLGDEKLFANLDPGEEVKLFPHAHRVSVVTKDGKYLGRLPDDLAARLRKLIKEGNTYQTLVKSIRPRDIAVFIRELTKGMKSSGSPSFPPEKIDYVSFTPPELVHKSPPIEVGEDLESAEGNI